MREPPVALPDAKLFARHMVMLYPAYLVVSWLIAAGSHPSLKTFFESNALNMVGSLSAFFAAALLAWESLHMRKAHTKSRECAEYDAYLDSEFQSRDKANPTVNARRLEQLGKLRRQNAEIKIKVEEYQEAKHRLAFVGFLILAVATMFQVSGSIIAQQSHLADPPVATLPSGS